MREAQWSRQLQDMSLWPVCGHLHAVDRKMGGMDPDILLLQHCNAVHSVHSVLLNPSLWTYTGLKVVSWWIAN